MKHHACLSALAALLLGALPALAVPPLINYQGRIVVGTTNHDGPGYFKFALVDNAGTLSYWRNDGGPPIGGVPATFVQLTVTKGLYSVLLGDSSITNMAAIPSGVFQAGDLRLRVWFSTTQAGPFELLSPDQRLAPTAYLADGSVTASTIADQAITTAKIADAAIDAGKIGFGAVTADKIMGGAVNISHLGAGPPGPGQVLGHNGADIAWVDPGGSTPTSGWALGGNAGTIAGQSFLGTTDNQSLVFKTFNLERLRLTTLGDLVLQMPGVPPFSVRNGLGVYGTTSAFDDGRTFAGINTLGPVLYGHSGGGLGMKSQTNQETLALRWNSSGVIVTGGLTASGDVSYSGKLGKLDTTEQFSSVVRVADFYLGHSTRRGTPGRAMVDDRNGATRILAVNFENAWDETHVGGLVTQVRTLRITGGADLAEPFQMKEEELEKGSVVVIDDEHPGRLKRSRSAYDTRVAGIISGANGVNPGIALHQEGVIEGGQNVALSGRVYVRADATGAPIIPGDLLTTSDTPGHAMKVTEPTRAQGAVIGKAMSSLSDGTGMVLVLVTLQ